jgi:hypothetical protein
MRGDSKMDGDSVRVHITTQMAQSLKVFSMENTSLMGKVSFLMIKGKL